MQGRAHCRLAKRGPSHLTLSYTDEERYAGISTPASAIYPVLEGTKADRLESAPAKALGTKTHSSKGGVAAEMKSLHLKRILEAL